MRIAALKLVTATVFSVVLAMPSLVEAQPMPGGKPDHPTGAEASALYRRHHDMQALMQDMAQEMGRMRDRWGDNSATAETQKELARKMKGMAELMNRMSGLMDRPTMKDAEANRQLEQMRKQMNDMLTKP